MGLLSFMVHRIVALALSFLSFICITAVIFSQLFRFETWMVVTYLIVGILSGIAGAYFFKTEH